MLQLYNRPFFFECLRAAQALDAGAAAGHRRFLSQQQDLALIDRPGTKPPPSPELRALEKEAIAAFERGEVFEPPTDVIGKPFVPRAAARKTFPRRRR